MSGALRPYRTEDRRACLEIFDSNVPAFLRAEERSGFERFLDAPGAYYVWADETGRVVGCGGYYVDGDVAGLSWGLVHRAHQGRGVGGRLLRERLELLRSSAAVRSARVRTSQHTAAFFRKAGFRLVEQVKDGYAPGLDRCTMRLELRP